MLNLFAPTKEDVMCTVRVVNTFESLGAHVDLDDGVTVEPGDEVLVPAQTFIATCEAVNFCSGETTQPEHFFSPSSRPSTASPN